MKHALGVAAVVLVLAARSESAVQVPAAGTGQEKEQAATAKAGRTSRRAIMVKLKPLDQGTVRRALDLALATLASPGCAQVYGDFELPRGGTPQGELDRMGIGPKEFLETLVFTDGGREPACRMGQAALAMKPGTRLVFVCPRFAAFQIANARMSASVIIHESLHALGLGENPPSGNEITQRVERRCWKLAKAAPVVQTDNGFTAAAARHDFLRQRVDGAQPTMLASQAPVGAVTALSAAPDGAFEEHKGNCLAICDATPTSARVVEGQPIVTVTAEDAAAIGSALHFLSRRPERVVVIDPARATAQGREILGKLDAFIAKDGHVVYVNRDSEVLAGARRGSSIHLYMLAGIIWHEMAHIEGADETEAQRREESLWKRFLLEGRVDHVAALRISRR